MTRITCQNVDGDGRECGRFLAEVQGPTLLIYCASCKRLHPVPLIVLAEELRSYLDETAAMEQEHKQKRRLVGWA